MDMNRIESAARWHDRLDLIDPFYGDVQELRVLAMQAPCDSLREWLHENIAKMEQRREKLADPESDFVVFVRDDANCPGCNANCCKGIFCIRDR